MRSRTPLVSLLVVAALVGASPAVAALHRPTAPPGPTGPTAPRGWHSLTSSGQRLGETFPLAPRYAAGAVTTRTTTHRRVAPGVTYTRFDLTDARGPNRGYLLAIRPHTRGLSIDYTARAHVTGTAPILQTLQQDHAVAGVNGDFYDIGVTGAPLGLGAGRGVGVLHGRESGWNSAFYLDRAGDPHMGTIPLIARIRSQPQVHVTNLNSPFVTPGGVGIYTATWGTTSGTEVTQGQKKHVEAVLVRHGTVVAKSSRLPSGGSIDGTLLIGRGAGAAALSALRIGAPARPGWHLQGNPPVAISGSHFLVLNGIVKAVDDTEMAPRTAVGIDDDTGEVLMVVIDGRSPSSRGMTMVELANLMVDLGCDDALNLDGGGSSTLVAKGTDGSLHVMNTPSDGFQRSVADGLSVSYHQPK